MPYGSLTLRLASLNVLLNLAVEASLVFLPLYARSLGASNLEVGFIAAAYGLSYFLSSLVLGRQSDMHGRLPFVRAGTGLSVIAYLSQAVAPTPATLLAARGLVGFCIGATSAAIVAYTYDSHGHIGRFSSYGSLGWLLGAALAAALQDYRALFFASAAASILAFSLSLTLREDRRSRIPLAVLASPVLRANRHVYLAFLLRQLGANAVWAVFPLFLASIGASQFWIAMLDVIGLGGQAVFMRYVDRLNPARAFRAGLLLSAVVFAAYGMSTSYLQILPVQVLLAVAWSCLFVGALSHLLINNSERGTASGLLYSTIYLSAGVGPFLGGAVSQAWKFEAAMYLASALALAGFLSCRGLSNTARMESKAP